jgi:uncharacterized membrane protein
MSESPFSSQPNPAAESNQPILIKIVPPGNAINWITNAFQAYAKEWVMWTVIGVIFVAIMVVLNFIPVIGMLAFAFLIPLLVAGIFSACRAQDEGRKLEIPMIFDPLLKMHKELLVLGAVMIGVNLLTMVIMVLGVFGAGSSAGVIGSVSGSGAAGVATVMGSFGILLVITLVLQIAVLMGTMYAVPLIYFQGLHAIPAIKVSFQANVKNIIPFLVQGLLLGVLCFIAMLPLVLGLLVMVPVSVISVYKSYRDIFA